MWTGLFGKLSARVPPVASNNVAPTTRQPNFLIKPSMQVALLLLLSLLRTARSRDRDRLDEIDRRNSNDEDSLV
jgi:hypothetical protein